VNKKIDSWPLQRVEQLLLLSYASVMDDLYFKADCEQSLIIEMGILNVIAALE